MGEDNVEVPVQDTEISADLDLDNTEAVEPGVSEEPTEPAEPSSDEQGDEVEGEAPEQATEEDIPEFSYEEFDKAESGSVFADRDGNKYKKVEGCDLPVPVIPDDSPMFTELKTYGFDQNEINEEFWAQGGELSEQTLSKLNDVFGPGLVSSYMDNVKAAHLAFLDSARGESEAAAREAEAAESERIKRDNEAYGIVGAVFGIEQGEGGLDAAKDKTQEIIQFVNENWPVDRRRDLKRVLETGSPYMLNTVFKSIKKDMEFNSGEVHNLVDLGNTPTDSREAADSGEVGNVLTSEQYNDLLYGEGSERYWSDPEYANKVDKARQRGIRLGK